MNIKAHTENGTHNKVPVFIKVVLSKFVCTMESPESSQNEVVTPSQPSVLSQSNADIFTSASTPLHKSQFELQQSVKESYHCPQCSFSTAWKSSLSIHLKTHTNERPWQCALCDKHFKLKHHLKHHILTHSSSKPFKCNLCNYKTADSRNIQRHKFNKHRTTFLKRRGAEKLSLPTMVPGTHGQFSGMNPFVEQNMNYSQGMTSNTPLCTPSFHGSLSSPVFQSPPAYNIAASSQWTQKSTGATGGFSQTRIMQNLAETTLADLQEKSMFFGSTSLHDSSSDSIPMVKEEAEPRQRKRTFTSDMSSDTPPSTGQPESNFSILNVTGAATSIGQKFVLVESDSNESLVAKNLQAVPNVGSKQIEPQPTTEWKCQHCQIVFPDNIMYGLHMGCHSVSNVFQCNICGAVCNDKHDFMFHFTIGKHQK